MTPPCGMDNKCVKYNPDPNLQWGVMAQTQILCMCDLDLGYWTLCQGHDTPLGHGQQLSEILSGSNLAVRSYGPDMDCGYVCTVTLTWKYDLGSRSCHTLGSWTIIVWNIIQIRGYDVMVRTRCEQTDRLIPIYPQTLFAGSINTVMIR